MAIGKWIGGFLGFSHGGPLGALIGFAIGWVMDKSIESFNHTEADYNNREYDSSPGNAQQQYEGQRNSFLLSLLALSSYIIRADGRIMHSEMEMVREFLRRNFGEVAVKQGEQILYSLFEQQKRMGAAQFRVTIGDVCRQVSQNLAYEQRLQLLNFLVDISKADGQVAPEEIDALRYVAAGLGIAAIDLESMLNLNEGRDNLEAAYKVLGISPTATNDEVKAAYRAMALKHHPDRVATLGDDIRKAAEKKFQEINDAKEKIYKARGL